MRKGRFAHIAERLFFVPDELSCLSSMTRINGFPDARTGAIIVIADKKAFSSGKIK